MARPVLGILQVNPFLHPQTCVHSQSSGVYLYSFSLYSIPRESVYQLYIFLHLVPAFLTHSTHEHSLIRPDLHTAQQVSNVLVRPRKGQIYAAPRLKAQD